MCHCHITVFYNFGLVKEVSAGIKKLTRQDLVASLYLYEFGHDNYSGSHCQILEVAGTYSYCDLIFTRLIIFT